MREQFEALGLSFTWERVRFSFLRDIPFLYDGTLKNMEFHHFIYDNIEVSESDQFNLLNCKITLEKSGESSFSQASYQTSFTFDILMSSNNLKV